MTDTFRKNYRSISQETRDDMDKIKTYAEDLERIINSVSEKEHLAADKRMIALAKTNLEQAIMWAVKAIT